MTRGQPIRRQALILVGFIVVSVAILIRILGYAGVSFAPGPSYEINAIVPSAIQLIEHADVREAGIRVGQVSSISAEGDDVRLGLSIEKRDAPVYENAIVLIRAKSLAGENYVALDPGNPRARALGENGTLPLTQAPESTQIDQVLATFSARRRRDLQKILAALGGGLAGRGADLNALLDGTAATVRNGLPVTEVVSSDRRAVAALIDDFGQVSAGLAQRAAGIRELAADSRRFTSAVAARDAELSSTLERLPGFLSQAQSTVNQLGGFARLATPVVANLRIATTTLVPAMDVLGPAALQTRSALSALGAFDAPGRRLLDALKHFAPVATTLLGPLETVMRQSSPALAYLAPYAHDAGVALTLIAAVAAYHDSVGHLARGNVLVGADSVGATLSPTERAAVNALLDTGLVQKLTGPTGTNPYPAPDVALKQWIGTYPRITEDPPYTLRSTR